ncbi:uncharacterized protein LOC108113676 [Drosophila eugracilis]|uniref:uncharacterized protein LOC108113676 n=1 Tax=Drosophila eugracilis TaxID=29029 RepID=UPI0007E8824D|nr:uncharacterized protein LOC108113676 [Drosophila eugracilis]
MSDKIDAEQFIKEELEPPSWLNSQFIGQILSEHEEASELQVIDLKIRPASFEGDHYASLMFRTTVEYTTAKGKFSKHLIVKTESEPKGPKKESHMFETEIGMYCHVLPEFERILREAGDKTKLFVPCLYHSLEPHKVMIFEDLVPLGYSLIRTRPVEKVELKTAFSKLAKWHAVSMKVIKEQPQLVEQFKYGLFDGINIQTDSFITSGIYKFIEMLDKLPKLKKYKPHFEKIKDSYLQRLKDEWLEHRENRRLDTYYVLSHGDFHIRNIMFKNNRETGVHEDAMLLDFQLSNVCPISSDLIFSIYMLLEPEQRREMGKDLIDYYFNVLLATLRSIRYQGDMPIESKFWEEIRRNKYFDFFLLSTFLPPILAVKSKSYKMHEIVPNPEICQKVYFMDTYVEDVTKLLPQFDKLGYFEGL